MYQHGSDEVDSQFETTEFPEQMVREVNRSVRNQELLRIFFALLAIAFLFGLLFLMASVR